MFTVIVYKHVLRDAEQGGRVNLQLSLKNLKISSEKKNTLK